MKRAMGAGALLLALAGLGLWVHTKRMPPMGSEPSPGSVAAAAAATGTDKPAAASVQDAAAALRQRLSELPQPSPAGLAAQERMMDALWAKNPSARWWRPPFDQVYPALRAAAGGGDLEAAYVLGKRSAQCRTTAEEHAPEKMLEQWEEEAQSVPPGPDARGRMETLRNRYAGDLAQYEACAAVGRDALDESLAWLERAGRGEVEGARLAYVGAWSEQAGRDRDELIADIERAAEQRNLAREWLQEGLVAGDEAALDQYIDAYSGRGGLFARDPVQEMAYRYARDLVQGRRVSRFDALWSDGPTRYGKMTSQQWDAAEAQGRALFKSYYEARPEWPDRAPP